MTRRFDVYAPLQDFYWPGQNQSFGSGVVLKRFDEAPYLSGLEAHVSKPEWERAANSDHWLAFQWVAGTEISAAEVINLFLLSLWLVKPIRSQVALRFEIGRDEAAGEKTMSRLLDRFAWIPGSIAHCTGPLMCVASLTHARPVNANVRPHIHLEDKTT